MNLENEITRLKRIVYFLQRKIGDGDGSLNAIIEQIQQDIIDLQNALVPNTGTYATGQIFVNLLGGLIVQVIWPIYYINGTEYAAGVIPITPGINTVTLNAADTTNDRFDAIILTPSGLSYITGTPSATPEQPTIDPTSQLLVTYILVEANQTDLTQDDIVFYDEGTETTVTGNGTFNDQSTAVTPISGTYVLSHGSFNSTNYLDFTFGTDQSIAQATQIKYFIYLISQFTNTTYLKFTFFKDGAAVSNTVNVVSGSYNFLRTTTGAFQVNIIPIGAFNFTNGLFDTIRITFNGSNASGFYFDFASLQVGITGVNPIYNFFKTILDNDGLPIVASQPNDILQIIGATKTGAKELTVAGGGGHTIQDEGTPLAAQPNLNFIGAGVTATNNPGTNATDVTIPGSSITIGDTQVLFADGANNPSGEAAFTYNKTTNKLTVDEILLNGKTASELIATDGSKNLVSLPVATYPSLAELAHVKGVTSAIQTQIAGVSPIGLQDLFIPSSAMWPTNTNGALQKKRAVATSLINIQYLEFSATVEKYCNFQISLPRNWNNGTITATFYWTAQSSSGDVIWGLQGGAYSNDDALTTALGTAQEVTDTLTATNDLCISSATAAITLAGTPADSDLIFLQAYRKAAAGGDNLGAVAELIGIRITITTDAGVAA